MLSRKTTTQYEVWLELFQGLKTGIMASGNDESTFNLARKHTRESASRISEKLDGSPLLKEVLLEWVSAHFHLIEVVLRSPTAAKDSIETMRTSSWRLVRLLAVYGWNSLKGFEKRINKSVDAFIEVLAARMEDDGVTVKKAMSDLKTSWKALANYAAEWLVT